MNLLSGSIVLLNCILSSKYLFDISYIRGIIIDEEEKLYQKKAINISIVAFLCSFIISIFGYLKNCVFLKMEARVLGVKQFVIFIVIMLLINLFPSEKNIYKLRKKFKYEKYIKTTKLIILTSIVAITINTFLLYK